jgi:hypothetical protein
VTDYRINGSRAAAMIVGVVVAVAVGMVGCGAPQYTYVKNSGERTYFKVPRQWHRVDQAALDEAVSPDDPDSQAAVARQQLVWSIAYDADAAPAPIHLFSGDGDRPFVYATVRRLTQTQQAQMSFDGLRNAILPVTDAARQVADQAGLPLDGFELLSDEVVHPRTGIRGVHIVFHYRVGGPGELNTFDQTAYVNDDASRMYLLLIRCSARYYRDHGSEVRDVATSFTVRSSS